MNYGFIFIGERFEQNLDTKTFKMKVVGVEDPEDAINIAKEMVANDVHLIELCGDFGPVWAGKIIESIDHAVPVGAVTYGCESAKAYTELTP